MSLTKVAGSGSGSVSQRHGSSDPDPDPNENAMDPQHSPGPVFCTRLLSGRDCNEVVAGDAVPVLAGSDHAEAPRVHGPHDRTQDGHREQEELHRGADPPGQERPDRPPGWIQQGGLTGISSTEFNYETCKSTN